MRHCVTRLSRREVKAMLGVNLKETRIYQEAKLEGRQEGRQEGEQALVLRQLTKRFGALPDSVQAQIQDCSLEQLELLSEALLDFQSLDEVQAWAAA